MQALKKFRLITIAVIISSLTLSGYFLYFRQSEQALAQKAVFENEDQFSKILTNPDFFPMKKGTDPRLSDFRNILAERPSEAAVFEAVPDIDENLPANNNLQPTTAHVKPVVKPAVPVKTAKPTVKKPAIGGGIGKPGPIATQTKKVDGKKVCKDMKGDHPGKSKNNPKGHIDGECCLDPDETPNANCYYPPEKYGKLIQKYLAKQK